MIRSAYTRDTYVVHSTKRRRLYRDEKITYDGAWYFDHTQPFFVEAVNTFDAIRSVKVLDRCRGFIQSYRAKRIRFKKMPKNFRRRAREFEMTRLGIRDRFIDDIYD